MIKMDAATVAKLKLMQQSVVKQTGITPLSFSLMVQVLVQWAVGAISDSVLNELAPSMLTLNQQRKAVMNEMLSFKKQMDPAQIKQVMKTLEKLKRNTSQTQS